MTPASEAPIALWGYRKRAVPKGGHSRDLGPAAGTGHGARESHPCRPLTFRVESYRGYNRPIGGWPTPAEFRS